MEYYPLVEWLDAFSISFLLGSPPESK